MPRRVLTGTQGHLPKRVRRDSIFLHGTLPGFRVLRVLPIPLAKQSAAGRAGHQWRQTEVGCCAVSRSTPISNFIGG
jgi:hypothetical protein